MYVELSDGDMRRGDDEKCRLATLDRLGSMSSEGSWRNSAFGVAERARACPRLQTVVLALLCTGMTSPAHHRHVQREFEEKCEIKTRTIGEAADLGKELRKGD